MTDTSERRRGAALRLLAAERSEEILPMLLEEIVSLGFARALVTAVDFDSSELRPTVSLNCPKSFQHRFRTSTYAMEHPAVQALHTQQMQLVPPTRQMQPVLCYPVLYRHKSACLEAERIHKPECLAVFNSTVGSKINLGEQVCRVCNMHSYAAVVCVELRKRTRQAQISTISELVEIANRQMARLFKTEYYFNRMSDMESTIAQMQTVMESMSDPVILTDNQHRVIMQNKAAERFFKLPDGVSEGRVRAVELNNMLFSAALSSMAVSGTSDSSRDMTLVDAIEGEEVLFEAVSAPSFTRDGRRTGMVSVLRDVTELRRADEELRQNYEKLTAAEEIVRQDRDRLNLIIENVGDPIVVCDKDSKIVLLDPLAAELLGTGRESSRSPVRLRNQAKLDAYITSFTYSFSDRESAPLRLVNPTSAQEIEYDAHSGKIYDERGQVAYTVTVLRDLTAVRRVEQLKLERRMLEMEKFAAAGRLAGTIAHEVNNPLEAIKNCIYLLANNVTPEAQAVYSILKTETERVARIVRQMLGLYRNTEQVGTFHTNTIIEDTLLLFARQLERSGVRIERELGDVPPSVGSADQLRQVLSNLVVNAKDSMSQGGVLRVRTRLLSNGLHETVRVLVGDTGCGIPPNMLQTMFEPFVTTKGERGTGLGLWIVKGIIENHGGKLRVRSRVGHGTVFKIDLPVVR
ncbi:MAG TPA: ATP-binding protein [Clostridia bacterium]|nr:ATP-binding protein [Clostridia bacterium]